MKGSKKNNKKGGSMQSEGKKNQKKGNKGSNAKGN